MNAKNGVSETAGATGSAGVGQTVTLTGRENTWNPTFAEAYGGAVTDIPVSIQDGDDWQTCRCDFNGTTELIVQSIQSQFKGGVYDDTAPAGITLSTSPVAQVSFNAASLVDSLGGIFSRFAGHDDWIDNPASSPTIDFADGNNHIANAPSVGVITLAGPPGVLINGQLKVNNPSTITSISVPGDVFWAGDAPPDWSTIRPDILSIIFDGTDAYIGVTQDFGNGSVSTGWLTGGNAAFGGTWTNVPAVYASDDTYATHNDNGSFSGHLRVHDFDPQIPAGATIIGIEVLIEKKANNLAVDDSVRMYDGVAAGLTGDNKAKPDVWPAVDVNSIYGGPTDDWGAGITDTIANNTGTGIEFQVTFNGDPVISVDFVQIRYWYIPV